MCVISWGCPPQTLTKETFREKFLGTSKAFAKINWYIRWESFCGFLRRFLGESALKQGPLTAVQHITKNKKRGVNRVFRVYYQLGLSAPNPDTRNFSGKVSWNFKSFAKVNWYIRLESFCGFLRGFLQKAS